MLKLLFLFIFLLIVFSLFSALFHLVKGQDQTSSQKTLKALTLRIGLSVALFAVLFLAYALGLIKPEGIGSRVHPISNSQDSIKTLKTDNQ